MYLVPISNWASQYRPFAQFCFIFTFIITTSLICSWLFLLFPIEKQDLVFEVCKEFKFILNQKRDNLNEIIFCQKIKSQNDLTSFGSSRYESMKMTLVKISDQEKFGFIQRAIHKRRWPIYWILCPPSIPHWGDVVYGWPLIS